MVRTYVKHPRPIKPIKQKCSRDWEREPRRYTEKDLCRISKYVAEDFSSEVAAATVLRCLEFQEKICGLLKFVSASLLFLEAIGEIAAVTAVGAALEKAYRLLMGAASKVPAIRIALAGLIVAIIFLRSVIGAIEAMIETSEDIREVLDDLQLICQIAAIDDNEGDDDG